MIAALSLPDLAAWQPDDFGAAASIGTLLVAVAATLIARASLKQARQLREEEAAPFIVVDIVPAPDSSFVLDLAIENVGKTLARDVRISFDPPLKSATDMSGYELSDWAALKEGITTLAPGRRLTALFDVSHERYESDLPKRYEVTVDCTDAHGRRQPTLHYTLDLEPLFGALTTDAKGLRHVVQELEKIRKALEPITRKPLRVETYDGETEQGKRADRRADWERKVAAAQERGDLPADPTPPAGPDSAPPTT